MAIERTSVRCSTCDAGELRHEIVTHNVGALLGMKRVTVTNLPALVCTNCGAVSLYGNALDDIAVLLAADILGRAELEPIEVRYLRALLGYTQEELGDRLRVSRATVNRWETAAEPLRGAAAYAVRSHAFFRLQQSRPIREVAPAFVEPARRSKRRRGGYTIEGSSIHV